MQSTEVICKVNNEDVVGAAPTGDAPTTSEWSTILLPIKLWLTLEIWPFISYMTSQALQEWCRYYEANKLSCKHEESEIWLILHQFYSCRYLQPDSSEKDITLHHFTTITEFNTLWWPVATTTTLWGDPIGLWMLFDYLISWECDLVQSDWLVPTSK